VATETIKTIESCAWPQKISR